MSISERSRLFLIAILLASLPVPGCKEAGVTPNGTVLSLTAQPQQVAILGTSNVTGSGTTNGTPLADGTVLRFVVETGTGRFSPATSETKNGTATVKFLASGVAGKVSISVVSGSSVATTEIEVIGDTNERIFLLANPPDLPAGGGTSALTAVVTDSLGNPLEGDRVLFSTTAGTLKSNGQFVTTDSEGHASDELNTNQTAEVKAEVVDKSADPAKLTIPVGTTSIVCSFTVSPQNPSAGNPVIFTDTTQIDPERIFNSIWDFGDEKSQSGVSVQHTYTSAGTYSIAHVLIDISNNTYPCPTLRLTVSP